MMEVLTIENKSHSMNHVMESTKSSNTPIDIFDDEEEDDLHFCIIDYTEEDSIDYQFVPLLFMESFNMSILDVSIGGRNIKVPADWSIVIGDKNSGELEVIELKKLTDREFDAFVFNPITGFIPDFRSISIDHIYPEIKWHVPKLKYGHLLACPITKGSNPDCVFIVKDINKLPDTLDLSQLI